MATAARSILRTFTLKRLGVAILVMFILWKVWLAHNVIVIEQFGVPRSYEELGYSSAVTSERIVDTLRKMEKTILTIRPKDTIAHTSEMKPLPDFEVPGTKVSLVQVLDSCLELFHLQAPHFSGEIALSWPRNGTSTKLENSGLTQITIRQRRGSDYDEPMAVHLPTDDPETAITAAAEAIWRTVNPYILAGYVGLHKRDLPKAITIIKDVIEHNAERPTFQAIMYDLWGSLLSQAQRHKEAIPKFERALELDPYLSSAYDNWGLALHELGDLQGAILNFQKAAKLSPDWSYPYSNWCVALGTAGLPTVAIEKCAKASELDPRSASVYLNWGNMLTQKAMTERNADLKNRLAAQAEEKYRRSAELDPEFEAAYESWGYALQLEGKPEDAIEKYQRATEIDPMRASAYFSWGYELLALNRRDEGMAKMRKAVQLDPSFAAKMDAAIH
jgi:tetratricopeptide (TPR) repeat protein